MEIFIILWTIMSTFDLLAMKHPARSKHSKQESMVHTFIEFHVTRLFIVSLLININMKYDWPPHFLFCLWIILFTMEIKTGQNYCENVLLKSFNSIMYGDDLRALNYISLHNYVYEYTYIIHLALVLMHLKVLVK